MIAEMIHTASLIHDDVIDSSNTRRGKATVDSMWGQKKVSNSGSLTHLYQLGALLLRKGVKCHSPIQ
jgi:geranylgeranyl pyrophosphate synthase